MRGFLGYQPFGAIINNIEEEHMDVYKNLDDIIATFTQFAKKIPSDGVLVYNGEDQNIKKILPNVSARKISVGINSSIDDFDIVGSGITYHNGQMKVNVSEKTDGELSLLGELSLRVPGRHNVMNTLGVIALTRSLGLSFVEIARGLAQFVGTWRRLEFLGEKNNIAFYDDYGHHPTEIKATLQALRELYPERKIILVLQLHQYERVKSLYNKFVQALKELQDTVNLIVLTDFYLVKGRDDESLHDVPRRQDRVEAECAVLVVEGSPVAVAGD